LTKRQGDLSLARTTQIMRDINNTEYSNPCQYILDTSSENWIEDLEEKPFNIQKKSMPINCGNKNISPYRVSKRRKKKEFSRKSKQKNRRP